MWQERILLVTFPSYPLPFPFPELHNYKRLSDFLTHIIFILIEINLFKEFLKVLLMTLFI